MLFLKTYTIRFLLNPGKGTPRVVPHFVAERQRVQEEIAPYRGALLIAHLILAGVTGAAAHSVAEIVSALHPLEGVRETRVERVV